MTPLVMIKKLRQQHHMTQRKLGRIIGVSQSTISNWERGQCHPKSRYLHRLSCYFGVPISFILQPAPFLRTDQERLIKAVSSLSVVDCTELEMLFVYLSQNEGNADKAEKK